MHFTAGIATLMLAVIGTSAAPTSNIENRDVGILVANFYSEADCKGDWLENNVYVDRGQDTCAADTTKTWKPYVSFKLIGNTAKRPCRLSCSLVTLIFIGIRLICPWIVQVSSKLGCIAEDDGSLLSIPGGETECYNQFIGSTQFVNWAGSIDRRSMDIFTKCRQSKLRLGDYHCQLVSQNITLESSKLVPRIKGMRSVAGHPRCCVTRILRLHSKS